MRGDRGPNDRAVRSRSGLTGQPVARADVERPNVRVGSLEPGKRADLIAVAGDPTGDVRAHDDLRLVVKGGTVVHNSPTARTATVV